MTPDDLCASALAFADRMRADHMPLETPVPGLTVLRSRAPTRLESIVYQPIFCLVLQGAKQAFLGERAVTFARLQSVIVSIDLPTVTRIVEASPATPYVALALRLDLATLRELAEDIGADDKPDAEAPAISLGETDPDIIDAMARLFALMERPGDVRILAPLIVREIHFRLLTAGHGAMLRRLTRPASHQSRIAKAISVIRRDFVETLNVADLAQTAGMSTSAFHQHFKAVTATTPLQFQKQLRLMEARRLLEAGVQSVAGAAYAVGYESPTQFSREFSRKFGEPPRAALTRGGLSDGSDSAGAHLGA